MARGKAKKNRDDVGEDDNSDRADWDSDLHEVFVKLCVDEKKKGNMPTTHFSSQGWENIVIHFTTETKRTYTRAQLKNHWDCMRKDWYAWALIKQKASGLDWDPEKKIPVVSKGWWEELAKANKLVLKYKKRGLEHDEEYSYLFSQVVRKADNALAPSQCISSEGPYLPLPLPPDQTSGYNDVSIEENRRDQTEDKNCNEMGSPKNVLQVNEFGLRDSPANDTIPPPPGMEPKGPTDNCQSCGCKRKRITDADKISDAFDGMGSHIEPQPAAASSPINDGSVKETLRILNQVPGVTKGSRLYLLACRLFANPYNRDLFIYFEDNDLRLTWLKDMELRETAVYPQQQLVHFLGGSSQLLAQPASEFSQQFAQPSIGFTQRLAQPTYPSTQWIAMPPGGFSQLLSQPSPGVVPNQFPSPSNALSPHSAPDA